MSKTMLLCSGQGSQYEGMGKQLLALCPEAETIYQCGSDITGMDLKQLCLEADAATLAQTKISQPAIFTTSLVAIKAMEKAGFAFDGAAGHSLGEYAAMVAAGMVSMEDGFRLIKERAACMQECAQQQSGSMCAILGLTPQQVEEGCAQVEGYVVPVNYNSPVQTVIAGETAAVDAAIAKFTEMGARRCVKLAVSAAFHSKLMQPAADAFYEKIKDVKFSMPKKEFYCNLTGQLLTDVSDMPGYLAKHIVSPVRFTTELDNMQQAGYDTFVECGPGKVLTGLVKKTLSGVNAINVEDEKTYQKALEVLGL